MSEEVETARKVFDLTLWVPVFVVAMWGGIVRWISDIQAGTIRAWCFTCLVGNVVISGFVGTVVVLPFVKYLDLWMLIFFAAVSGALSSQMIKVLETIFFTTMSKITGIPIDQLRPKFGQSPTVANLAPVPKHKGGNSQTDHDHEGG